MEDYLKALVEPQDGVKAPSKVKARGRPKRKQPKPKSKQRVVPRKVESQKEAMTQFRERILRSPKAPTVLTSIFDAALDKDDPHRAVAWKLLIDRIAPLRHFEGSEQLSRSSVNITITGVGSADELTGQTVAGEVIDQGDEQDD